MTYSRFLQGGKKGGEFPRRLSATRVSLVSVAAVLPEVTPVRANVAAVMTDIGSVAGHWLPQNGREPRQRRRTRRPALLKRRSQLPPLAAETCL